jgi:hypothetical protein
VGEWLGRVAHDTVRCMLAELVHAYFPSCLFFPDTPSASSLASAEDTIDGGDDGDGDAVLNDLCGEAEWRVQDGWRTHGVTAIARVASCLRTLEAILRCDGYEIMREHLPAGRDAGDGGGGFDASSPTGAAAPGVPFAVLREGGLKPLSKAQCLGLSKYFVFATVWGMGGYLSASGSCVCCCRCCCCRCCCCCCCCCCW